ncbi:MAG TPA: hypothetical protein VEB20_02315 [Azospirillaceae bacterium]|nr:hypothetical protein [Azospirillaceae bacterium]
MISLVENRILTGEEARGLLEDACHAVERGGDAVGAEAVRHVQRIIEGTFNVNADGNGDPAPLMDGQ